MTSTAQYSGLEPAPPSLHFTTEGKWANEEKTTGAGILTTQGVASCAPVAAACVVSQTCSSEGRDEEVKDASAEVALERLKQSVVSEEHRSRHALFEEELGCRYDLLEGSHLDHRLTTLAGAARLTLLRRSWRVWRRWVRQQHTQKEAIPEGLTLYQRLCFSDSALRFYEGRGEHQRPQRHGKVCPSKPVPSAAPRAQPSAPRADFEHLNIISVLRSESPTTPQRRQRRRNSKPTTTRSVPAPPPPPHGVPPELLRNRKARLLAIESTFRTLPPEVRTRVIREMRDLSLIPFPHGPAHKTSPMPTVGNPSSVPSESVTAKPTAKGTRRAS